MKGVGSCMELEGWSVNQGKERFGGDARLHHVAIMQLQFQNICKGHPFMLLPNMQNLTHSTVESLP